MQLVVQLPQVDTNAGLIRLRRQRLGRAALGSGVSMKSTPALLTSRQAELPAQFFGAHHLLVSRAIGFCPETVMKPAQ